MPKQIKLGATGLVTSPNRLSEVPEASMSEATNVVIRRDGIVETRRGVASLGGAWSSTAVGSGVYIWNKDATAYSIAIQSTNLSYNSRALGVWSDYSGSFSPPNANYAWIRFAEAKKNLYFSSSTGVFRLDAYNGTPVLTGIPKPLSVLLAAGGATGGWLTNPGSVAYRAVIKYTDANSNVFFSAPSGRAVHRKSAGAAEAVAVTVYLPSGLSSSYSVQVFRSAQTSSASDEPSDEMGLVYERKLTSGEATARSVAITSEDVVPDIMRGTTGYFCPSQQGINQANERPPIANDICWHKGVMSYASTTGRQRLSLRLLSVDAASGGLQNNDTVGIAGVVYVAKTTPAGTTDFQLTTSGTAQTNVQATALALVNKINTTSSNTTVYAYVLSGSDDPAGIFFVEERGLGAAAFTAIGSRAKCWAPELEVSGTNNSSSNDAAPNRIYESKVLEPEAVPLTNFYDVAASGDRVLRVIPLRDSIFAFKEFEGLYRVTGEPGNKRVQLFDPTVQLVAPRSAVTLGNQIYALTTMGVVAISDVGVKIVSRKIEDIFTPALTESYRATTRKLCHAIGNEADGLYVIWLPNVNDDVFAGRAYVYCPATDAWTMWDHPASSSAYEPQSNIYYIQRGSTQTVSYETKDNASTDYDDVGVAISTALTWNISTAGNPVQMKQWSRADFLLQAGTATSVTAGFATDLDTTEESVVLSPASGAAVVSSPVPLSKQLGTNLTLSLDCAQANKQLIVTGAVLTYEEGADFSVR